MAENECLSPQMSLPTKFDDDSINFRRIDSTKKKASSVSGEKPIPHYLRASTGSCHDFCKFGHKNESEEKLKHPIPKRPATKPTDSHVLSDTVASLGKKKSVTMTRSLDSLNIFESDPRSERKNRVEVSLKPLKLEVSLKKEKKPSVKRSASLKSKPVTSLESSGGLNGKTKVTSRVSSMKNGVGSLNRKQNGSKKTLSHVVKTESEESNATSAESFEVEEKTLHVVKKKSKDNSATDSDQTESLANEVECVVKFENGDSALELDQKEGDIESVVEMENLDCALELDQKEADIESIVEMENGDSALELDQKEADVESIVEMENEDSALELDQKEANVESIVEMENGDSALELDQKEADVESIVEMENGDSALELDQKEADAESSVEMENGHSALELEQKDTDANSIAEMENGDYALELDQSELVVEIRTEIDTLESDQNKTFEAVVIESLPGHPSSSSSSSSSSSLPQEDEEDLDEEFEQYIVSEFGDDMTLSENSEDEATEAWDPSHIKAREDNKKVWKMKFRRGTVVEIRDEDNAPRRLRFRRRDDGGVDDGTEENGSERRVVLKHQDVKEGKRDARGLFNLVIKETASKLVESRKSKVKALVGAFETVISLQDAKPSLNSVS